MWPLEENQRRQRVKGKTLIFGDKKKTEKKKKKRERKRKKKKEDFSFPEYD